MITKRIRRTASLVLVVFAASAIVASGEDLPTATETPDLVLVLSGGGARGAAHIGVLRVLEELHIAPDMIVGTSMGSIVGGLYAAGWSPDEIEDLLVSIDWNQVFSDRIPRDERSYRRKQDERPYLIPVKLRFGKGGLVLHSGLLGGQSLELLLRELEARSQPEKNFDELPVPFRAVATDLLTATPVVINNGSLATAMRASMAIPGIFAPVEINGQELADGGSVANLPVGVAQELGAKAIIAVDITSPLAKPDKDRPSFLDVIQQANDILTVANRRQDVKLLGADDVYIRPDLKGLSFIDFDRADEMVVLGEAAARMETDRLRRHAVSDDAWQAYISRQRRRPTDRIRVDRLRLDNDGRLNDDIELRALDIDPPLEVDPKELRKDIMRLHHLQPSGTIGFQVEDNEGKRELVISTPQPPFGRNSLQFGLGFLDDFQGDTGYSISARHQMLPINRNAGEWENFLKVGTISHLSSELYQPLSTDLRWFAATKLGITKRNQQLWFEGQPYATYRLETASWRLGGGRVFGNWGELALGAFVSDNRADLKTGDPFFPDFKEHLGGLDISFEVDTENSVMFPRSGTDVDIRFSRNLESFGSDRDSSRVHGRWSRALSFGEYTLSPYLEYGENFDPGAEFFDLFFLGGPGRLSGLGVAELYGEKLAFARLGAHRRLKRIDIGGIRVRLYAGLTLEAGNVFTYEASIDVAEFLVGGDVFVGAETPIGPLYLGYGYTQGGRYRWFLAVGDNF